jgi:LysM repeat protein
VAATSRPLPTSTRACGPYTGWIRSYVVQPGDTLFRIAIMHGITVESLQRANCKTGTVIYSGERLWVPFVLPMATELTIIPTFDTPTSEVTPTSSPTPIQTTAP